MPEFQPEPLPTAPEYPAPAYPVPAGYGAVPPPLNVRQDEYDGLPPLSQGERVIDTYVAPSKTFADIRRNRSWWLPFLLLVLMSLVFGAVVQKRVGVTTLAENMVRSNPKLAERMENMPPDQRATAMKATAVQMQVGIYGGPIFVLLWVAFLALLLWVGFNFILGGSSTYPGMFAVAMYGSLPGLLAYLLMIVMLFVGDPETFNLASPIGTNIGYYLPQGASPLLKSLLGSIDLFTLWNVFLFGLGASIVARVKKSTGLAMVFGVWVLIVLVKAGIVAATS